jgi:hypothetical protein
MIGSRSILVSMLLILMSECSFAQFQQNPYDAGAADSIAVTCSIVATAQAGQYAMQAKVYLLKDVDTAGGMAFGFNWDNPKARLDSAGLSPTVASCMGDFSGFYRSNSLDSSNLYHRFVLWAFRSAWPGIVASSQYQHLATFYFTLSNWSAADLLVIDTSAMLGIEFHYTDNRYHLITPYWKGPVTARSSCCVLRTGDANCSGGDEPTIGDFSTLIDFLFISGNPPCCIPEADVNQSGGANPTLSSITISDCSYLQDYLFITGPSLGLPNCY